MVQQLLYTSTAKSDEYSLNIDAILASSQKNNSALGITGFLLQVGPKYYQWLEGSFAAVQFLRHRIEQDPRHTDLTVLYEAEGENRYFGRWLMGYGAIEDYDPTIVRLLDGNKLGIFDIRDMMLDAAAQGGWSAMLSKRSA